MAGPIICSVLMSLLGPNGFFVHLFIFLLAIIFFGIYRVNKREYEDNPESTFTPLPREITPLGIELDPDTGLPAKEKVSKMSVCLDKSMGGTEIGEAEFNMADFKFGEYKIVRLYLRKSAANTSLDFNPDQTFIDLALKGTRSSGLVK